MPSESDQYNDDELNDIFNNMDIDKDFNIDDSDDDEDSKNESNKQIDLTPNNIEVVELDRSHEDWMIRMQRNEIYSRHYTAHEEERAEIVQLEKLLGVSSGDDDNKTATGTKPKFGGMFMKGMTSMLSTDNASNLEWSKILYNDAPAVKYPKSILLKKGNIQYDTSTSSPENHQLILLTHGFVIAYSEGSGGNQRTTASNFMAKMTLGGGGKGTRKYQCGNLWNQISSVEPIAGKEKSFQFIMNDASIKHQFTCDSYLSYESWFEAIQKIICMLQISNPASSQINMDELGWQYQVVHVPLFYQATTNKGFDNKEEGDKAENDNAATQTYTPDQLNRIDVYNQYTPLHYAVRLSHVEAIQYLLELGCDPNAMDGTGKDSGDTQQGKTPMYYAQRDQMSADIINLLKQHGGIEVEQDSGEMFSKVDTTTFLFQQAKDRKQRELEAAEEYKLQQEEAKALKAKQIMAENMNLMKQRGEQIELMGHKADDMNQNAQDYADLAGQLKRKLKMKASGWNPF